MVKKGRVSTVKSDGNAVTVTPFIGGTVTPELVVPLHLSGLLAVGDVVIYAIFDDNSGIVLHKADGSGQSTQTGGISAKIEDGILRVYFTNADNISALDPESR